MFKSLTTTLATSKVELAAPRSEASYWSINHGKMDEADSLRHRDPGKRNSLWLWAGRAETPQKGCSVPGTHLPYYPEHREMRRRTRGRVRI